MLLPDYRDASIVNLMASLRLGMGAAPAAAAASPYAPLPALPPQEVAAHRNVILLVIDGMGYQFLMAEDRAPALKRHVRGRITSVFPPTTASAVTTFLTGAAPQQHGLTGWFMYFKELGAVCAVLPGTPRYGKTPFSQEGLDPVAFFGHRPFFEELRVPGYLIQPDYLTHSDFSRAHSGRAERRGYRDMPRLFREIRRAVKRDRHPKYVYAYWAGLDSLGHDVGMGSAQAREHLTRLDAHFAGLCDDLAGTDTLLLVTADHGQVEVSAGGQIWVADHPQLAETLVLPLCGEPRVAYCYVRPDRCASFEDYVGTEMAAAAELVPSGDLLRRAAFGLGEPHPRLADRIGDYALVMREGYVIRDRLFGEEPPDHVGVHGGVSEAELYVPLVACEL
jgi:hypothetical protein